MAPTRSYKNEVREKKMLHIVALITLLLSVSQAKVLRKGLVPQLDGRIYGGSNAKLGQLPYQASMRFWGFHRCGAVLIRHDAVITAAHCVYELTADTLEIVLGTLYRNRGGQERKIRLIFTHEEYDEAAFDNDISILLLEKSLDFGVTIQPIPLASVGEEILPGSIATISGWGTINEQGHYPDVLQLVRVRIVANSECEQAYLDDLPVTENMICAGEPRGGKDACSGDSGGPLVVAGKLYGLVSWGNGCAKPDYPGVYTKISALREWINVKLYG